MKEDKNQYIEDDKRLNKDDNNVEKYHAFSYADEKTNTPENNNQNNYESNDDYQSEGYRNERFQSVKIRKEQQDNKKNPNDRLLKRLNNIRKNYNSGQNIKKDLDDEEESNVQPKSNLSSSNMNQNNNGLNAKQNNNDNSINNNDFSKDNKLSNEDKLNKEQKQEETKPVNKSNGLENKREEDKKESNDKNQGKTNSSNKAPSFSKTSPKTSVLNNIKSKALNKIGAKSENAQKTGNAVEKVDRIQRVVAFISKYKYVLLIAGAILIFVLLFMIFLEIFASAAVGNDEDEFSYSYYLNNFSQANFVLLDDSGNIIEENVNLKDLTIGVFYSYFGNQQLTEEQYKASLILIKTNILKNANFDSSDLTMNFNNYGQGKYCNPHVGCIEHITEKGNVVAYSNLETLSIEGLTEDPTPAMDNGILTSLESAYDATEYLIVAKPGDSDFSQIPSSDYNGELINDEIANSIKNSSGTYNEIISSIVSDYEVIDAQETFVNYNISICENGDWWFPVSNDDSTCSKLSNGALFCPQEATGVKDQQNYPRYNSTGEPHRGIDFSSNGNHNIIAAQDGVVESMENNFQGYYGDPNNIKSRGNYVLIKHSDNLYSMYMHMKYHSVTVKVGDPVVQGQKLGVMGNTGHSNGQHLHFQVQTTTSSKDHINPNNFVSINNQRPGMCTGTESTYQSSKVKIVTGSDSKQTICLSLKANGYSDNYTAAILANNYYESGFQSKKLEICYHTGNCCKYNGKDYGWCVHKSDIGDYGKNDEVYTTAVDSGKYTNFINDAAGYGIAQWTYDKYKEELLNNSKNAHVSIGDLNLQIEYLITTENRERQKYTSMQNPSDDGSKAKKSFYSSINSETANNLTYMFCRYYENGGGCADRKATGDKMLKYVKNSCKEG